MPSSDAGTIRAGLESGTIRHVLAVRASRIGDLLFTTPALHAFKQRHPATRVTFLTNAYSLPLLAGNPDVDATCVMAAREAELGTRVGARVAARLPGTVDLLLALRPRPELERFAERAGIAAVFPREDPTPHDRQRHVVEQGVARLAPLGIHGPAGPMRLFVADAERAAACERLPAGNGPLLVAHPGCDETIRFKLRRGVRRRVWPAPRWSELLIALQKELGARVVVTSGSAIEAHWVDTICRAAPGSQHVAQPSLRAFAALAASAAVVVSVDTGPLHVAAAAGTPIVGLYGPSPVSFTGPWAPGGRATVVRHELPCAPCQGRDVVCRSNVCMLEIDVREVVAAVAALLSAAAGRDGSPPPMVV